MFDRQIKEVESEIIALKTTRAKSASDLKLAIYSIDLNFTLRPSGVAEKMFRVVASRSGILFTATLNKGDETDGRYFWADKYYDTTSDLIHTGAFGNNDDITRAAGGETVTLTATLTVIATDEIELTEVPFT